MIFIPSFLKYAISKSNYYTADWSKLDPSKEDEAWSAKIDGAHTIVKLKQGEKPRLFSHRISKRTGKEIEYTDKLPHIKNPSLITARLRAETYATDSMGRAVHPEIVGAMLNRGVERSKELQKELGLKTQTALIDIDKIDGSAHKMPFAEKRKFLEGIVKTNPDFTLPSIAHSKKDKQRLKERIATGEHEQTDEGLIIHHLSKGDRGFGKAKIWNEHDVTVHDIFPEEKKTKERPTMAGGFTYGWSENDATKGRVGSGFSHEMKQDMLKNPNKYIGRVARVKAQRLSNNKALIKPVFNLWHVEKNIEKTATIFAKQSILVSKNIAQERDDAKEVARKFADKIYTSRGTSKTWRFRQRSPKLFIPGSFRVAHIKPGISIIYGQIDEKRKK